MRAADADILIVPGWTNSGPDHWQTRWERRLSTARRVEQDDWDHPVRDAWVARLREGVAAAQRPVVLLAHSCGASTVVHAAAALGERITGAFLVAVPDFEQGGAPDGLDPAFSPLPLAPLPFPSVLVASTNDPHCRLERAREFATAWGSQLIEAGDAGHINTASGHGPWPDGLLRFGTFLSRLAPKA
jgi:predicted alpha/beta hydrolase family esterase